MVVVEWLAVFTDEIASSTVSIFRSFRFVRRLVEGLSQFCWAFLTPKLKNQNKGFLEKNTLNKNRQTAIESWMNFLDFDLDKFAWDCWLCWVSCFALTTVTKSCVSSVSKSALQAYEAVALQEAPRHFVGDPLRTGPSSLAENVTRHVGAEMAILHYGLAFVIPFFEAKHHVTSSAFQNVFHLARRCHLLSIRPIQANLTCPNSNLQSYII